MVPAATRSYPRECIMMTLHLHSPFPGSDLRCLSHVHETEDNRCTNIWHVICSNKKQLSGPYLSLLSLHRQPFGVSHDNHTLPWHLGPTVWLWLQPVSSSSSCSRVSVPGGRGTGVAMRIECWQQMRLTPLARVCGFYCWFASPSLWKTQWWPRRHYVAHFYKRGKVNLESLLSNLIVRLFPSIEKIKHTGRQHTPNTHRHHTRHTETAHPSHRETSYP